MQITFGSNYKTNWAGVAIFKDSQMRNPSLLSGPKIRKAYFEVSNPKMLLQCPPPLKI